MRPTVVSALALLLVASGCATINDRLDGMEPAPSRTLDAPVDSTWAAAVEAIRPYAVAEANRAEGVLVTNWVERLLDPAEFSRRGIPKERARFEIAIAAHDGGSRITVRRTVQLLVPMFVDPVSPGPNVLCQYPYPADIVGASPRSALYRSDICGIENPSEKAQVSPVYLWQDLPQVKGASALTANGREVEILDATEAALKRPTVEREAPNAPPGSTNSQ